MYFIGSFYTVAERMTSLKKYRVLIGQQKAKKWTFSGQCFYSRGYEIFARKKKILRGYEIFCAIHEKWGYEIFFQKQGDRTKHFGIF